jgi:zinc protease
MGLSEARKYETGFQKAGFLSQILEYNLPEDFSKKQNELLNKITKEELLSLWETNKDKVKKPKK